MEMLYLGMDSKSMISVAQLEPVEPPPNHSRVPSNPLLEMLPKLSMTKEKNKHSISEDVH